MARKPYGNPSVADAGPMPPPEGGDQPIGGGTPEGQPPVGSPEEAESNPVMQGLKALMQFGMALKEKGDKRGVEILSHIQGIVQALGGQGGESPQGQEAPEQAPQGPKAMPMQGVGMNVAKGSVPIT